MLTDDNGQGMKRIKGIDLSLLAPGLETGEDRIWYASERQVVSYPGGGNDQCFEIEDKSFWFQHRNACIVELVKRFPPPGNGPIFDVGGGNGFVAKGLMDAGWSVVLVEPGLSGARNARGRGLPHVVCATTHAAGFQEGCMSAIGVFDVVEHINDDVAFLRHLWDLLEPDGMLYVTVPAYLWAWSDEDIYAGHFRRYTKGTLTTALRAAGFKVRYISDIFSWLLVPVLLLRTLPYRLRGARRHRPAGDTMRSDHTLPALVAPLANAVHRLELKKLSRNMPLSLGSSLICAAQKQ